MYNIIFHSKTARTIYKLSINGIYIFMVSSISYWLFRITYISYTKLHTFISMYDHSSIKESHFSPDARNTNFSRISMVSMLFCIPRGKHINMSSILGSLVALRASHSNSMCCGESAVRVSHNLQILNCKLHCRPFGCPPISTETTADILFVIIQ